MVTSDKVEASKIKIIKAMEEAARCQAWSAAIILARILEDEDSANKFADKIVEIKTWNITVSEKTAERMAKERAKILSKL